MENKQYAKPKEIVFELKASYASPYGASVKFIQGLSVGELWGTRFQENGPVFCPPRTIGPNGEEPKWVQLTGNGTVFVCQKLPGENAYLTYVQPEGAVTLLLARVEVDEGATEPTPGNAVKLKAPAHSTGTIRDLVFDLVAPVEEPAEEEPSDEEAGDEELDEQTSEDEPVDDDLDKD